MKRRNFLAMASSVFLAPFAFLRDKPTEVASGLSGCPVGPKGEQGQPGFVSTPSKTKNPWYTSWQQAKKAPPRHMPEPTSWTLMIEVDHSLLRWDGPEDQRKYSRVPWITLERSGSDMEEGHPGRLIVDQLMPARAVSIVHEAATDELPDRFRIEDGPCEPQMHRAMELDLADPYQLLLADLLIRGLIDKGVIRNKPFISSWNQVVIDSQMRQFTDKVKDDPDAPAAFITENVFRTIQAIGAEPAPGPPGPSRCLHAQPPRALWEQLESHRRAIASLERRQREGVPTSS